MDRMNLPDAPARLISPSKLGEPWTFRVQCPFCPKVHIHGAGPSAADAHTHYGTTVAHCTDLWRNGKRVFAAPSTPRHYVIVPAVQR